ncbi:hypothetical protein JQ560_51825 [Bradyrhizobium liaoningense]|nr:hypothetical protein [Bradyrhizobium liaoningense]
MNAGLVDDVDDDPAGRAVVVSSTAGGDAKTAVGTTPQRHDRLRSGFTGETGTAIRHRKDRRTMQDAAARKRDDVPPEKTFPRALGATGPKYALPAMPVLASPALPPPKRLVIPDPRPKLLAPIWSACIIGWMIAILMIISSIARMTSLDISWKPCPMDFEPSTMSASPVVN